jgi:hypothetical protein
MLYEYRETFVARSLIDAAISEFFLNALSELAWLLHGL